MANGHGGARLGAGRKPKALQYDEQVTAVEEKIVEMLPRLVDKLSEMAMEGDFRAARYLIDRIMGRVPVVTAAPSMDRSMPYGERDFAVERLEHNLDLAEDELRLDRRMDEIFGLGIEDDEETYDDLIPMSPEETADLLRKARSEQEAQSESGLCSASGLEQNTPSPSTDAPVGATDGSIDAVDRAKGDAESVDGPGPEPDNIDTPALAFVPFMASDGPNDPYRTWYDPSG
jgi:hypothetical protein